MSEPRPQVLVLEGHLTRHHPVVQKLGEQFDVHVFADMNQAVGALRRGEIRGVFADVGDFLPLERAMVGDKSSLVLDTIGEGVCAVDDEGRLTWTNRRMRMFSDAVTEEVSRICKDAYELFTHQTGPIEDHKMARSKKYTTQVDDRHFELVCSPVVGTGEDVVQVVAVVWDVTSGRRLQGKIDAIDAAGRELGRIEDEAVAKLKPADRLRLLQDKIIRFSKDLMHFDHFAIRLLDKNSSKLEVVIAEGLPPNALSIDLYAESEGNGISGYVASSGRSYICHDIERDPRYVQGLDNAHSSLTVPLMLFDRVVGVYNIESNSVGAFDEDDRQFAEIFGRYVAMALHILDLLVIQRYTTSETIASNVLAELAVPMNDIETEVRQIMEAYLGDEKLSGRLKQVLEDVSDIRMSVKEFANGPQTIVGSKSVECDEQDPVLSGKRILVADDEPNIRQTVTELLAKHGCQVTTCDCGVKACSELAAHDFDLVLSDIKMPDKTGYEVFAAAHARRDDLPVMLMTGFGYDPNHSIVRATQEGLASVLFKPFKAEQLIEEIRNALQAGDEANASGSTDSPHAT